MAVVVPREPYQFDPAFERAVATLCARSPRFWARVGHALDPECVAAPEAKLVLQACALIQHRVGHGPSSTVLVLQRLRAQVAEGRITQAQVDAVGAYFDAAEDFGLPPDEEVAAELVPLIRRRLHSQAILTAHDEYARRGDFKVVADTIARAERLGEAELSAGTLLGAGAEEVVAQMTQLVRLPTGVLELDLQMRDGLHRTGLGVVLGGSGDGKSMYLINQAAVGSVAERLFVGVATLELPKPVQVARLMANMTGVPTNLILENPDERRRAWGRYEVMRPSIGGIVVEEFSPHATTVLDVRDWCDRSADTYGRKFDLLVVDYGDKLYEPRVKSDNEYVAMRYVYEGLRRDIAVARDMWVWTGAQASRPGKDQAKRLELHHVSDSMHKVRVADLVLTLNARDDGAQILYFVAKNRLGRARFQVGPVPTDFERARMVVSASEWADWASMGL